MFLFGVINGALTCEGFQVQKQSNGVVHTTMCAALVRHYQLLHFLYTHSRLSEQAQKHFSVKGSTKFEDLSLGENRPSELIRRFGNLYSEGRVDAFDALDALPEMAEFDDLKGKLLFSVVVVSVVLFNSFISRSV